VCCTGKMTLAARPMTSVGTWIVGSTLRTSTSYHCRAMATAVAGLADMRWTCAYQRRKLSSPAMAGAIRSRSAPLPQVSRIAAAIWSMSA
jgi:hypothetical protein